MEYIDIAIAVRALVSSVSIIKPKWTTSDPLMNRFALAPQIQVMVLTGTIFSQLLPETDQFNTHENLLFTQASLDRPVKREASTLKAVSRRYEMIRFQYVAAFYKSLHEEDNDLFSIVNLIKEHTAKEKQGEICSHLFTRLFTAHGCWRIFKLTKAMRWLVARFLQVCMSKTVVLETCALYHQL